MIYSISVCTNTQNVLKVSSLKILSNFEYIVCVIEYIIFNIGDVR